MPLRDADNLASVGGTSGCRASGGSRLIEIKRLPEQLRRSLTWDQGKEMAGHVQFAVDTNVNVFFCDPHSPWQCGSNENTNGLLRQYFPKGTDLDAFSRADLAAVAGELNGRPRQRLGWRPEARWGASMCLCALRAWANGRSLLLYVYS
jgi:IS30 family transposase